MEITDRTRRLLLEKVDSFEKLETLALLAGASGPVTVRDAAHQLGLPEALIQVALLELAAASILEKTASGFRYAPSTPELVEDAGALAAAYRLDRIRVLNVVTTAALERIRS